MLDEATISLRLKAYEECGRSVRGCTAVVSTALRTSTPDKSEEYVTHKAVLRTLMERLKKSRAAFVSYDAIAPKLCRAKVILEASPLEQATSPVTFKIGVTLDCTLR